MKYNHLIWDWNGTLVDDAWLCVDIMNKILTKHRLPLICLDSYRKHFVFPVRDYYLHLGFDFTKKPFEVCGLDFINSFKKRKFEASLFHDATDALKVFKKKHVQLSVLSANHQKILEETINYFHLSSFFGHVVGLNHYYANSKVSAGKALLKKIKTDKKLILLVGDTVHDFEVAKALNIDCALIARGHNSLSRLKKTGAPVLSGLTELLDYSGCTVN